MFTGRVAAVVALPKAAALVDRKLSLVTDLLRGIIITLQTQGEQGVVQALLTLAVNHPIGDARVLQRLTHQGVKMSRHLRTHAFQAVGHSGQVQACDQGDVVETMMGQSHGVEAFVIKQKLAVDGGHQWGGVR